jgi:hypothetical protein
MSQVRLTGSELPGIPFRGNAATKSDKTRILMELMETTRINMEIMELQIHEPWKDQKSICINGKIES